MIEKKSAIIKKILFMFLLFCKRHEDLFGIYNFAVSICDLLSDVALILVIIVIFGITSWVIVCVNLVMIWLIPRMIFDEFMHYCQKIYVNAYGGIGECEVCLVVERQRYFIELNIMSERYELMVIL